MDGASKFVKGDAVAGVIIVAINLIGGIIVGVLQQHLSLGEAVHTFSILTIGDGLAAQIPALLISTATGILVTRSASTADLGSEISGEMLGQPRAPMIAGAVIASLALVPGLPKLPFFDRRRLRLGVRARVEADASRRDRAQEGGGNA